MFLILTLSANKMNEEPYPTTTESIKRSFQLDEKEENEEKEAEAKEEEKKKKKDKGDAAVTEATTKTTKTLIIVPNDNSNSGKIRAKSEVAVGQPHPFQVNTPLKLFDPKRPETLVPKMTI